ncbi:hypothetical protein [Natrinema sp. 74]|uniref:hypothetical protein n=1 Tax=Natrinema sp. 74 TaxID=3384159 RepID=UPI0038D44518
MPQFTIAAENHEQSAEIARAILETAEREPVEIGVAGIEPLLVDYVDAASVARLREAGARVEDSTLVATVEATPETVNAALALFSDSLLTARFVDDAGTAMFERSDTNAESCRVTPSEYERLCETLPFELATALRPLGESAPTERFGSLETDQLEAYSIEKASPSASLSIPSALQVLLEQSERDAETIELVGSGPLLDRVDAESVATIVDAGATRDEFRLVGTVPATSETVAAVLELLTDALFELVVRDEIGQPLFVREQPGLEYCYLTASASDRVVEALNSAAIEPDQYAPK